MQDRSSFTAATVALQRAFESHRPAESRLFVDPYADAFLSGGVRVLARASRLRGLRPAAVGLYDLIVGPGPRPSAIARTRAIDDLLAERAPDFGQLVILGAGFDTRAHRLPSLGHLRIFEVDHPATQEAKRAVVARLGLRSPKLVYVAVDFERDDLATRLGGAGFARATPTIFLWEGVTNYLTAAAVDATLATLRDLAASGALLVFTYVHEGALDGSVHFPEAKRWLRAVARAGEPWTFGLRPERLGAFCAERGYELISDRSTADIGEQLFRPLARRERPSALYRVAVARTLPARGA